MKSRWKKLEQKLSQRNLEAFILINNLDIFYFSGFWIEGVVLFTPQKKFLITSPMYREVIEKSKNEWEIIICKDTLENELGRLSHKLNIKRCGFESNRFSFALCKKIEEKFQPQLVPCEGIVEKIRSIKDEKEINCIKEAGKITVSTFDYLKKLLSNKVTEKEIVRKTINYILNRADGLSFYPIVLFGPRTSLPHGHSTNQKLKDNQLVLIDIGAKIKGYCADMTRTFFWGEVPKKWEKIYNLVETLKEMAIQHIKPGIKSSKIDKIIREEAKKEGYSENFLHGTGHGVGLEVHEQPFLNNISNTVLEEGMVITVEPGLYFAEEGGIRIEDMVLVTNQGGQVLS